MPYLFHQNMENYGGTTIERNKWYRWAFNLIRSKCAADEGILVAGFTEITNWNIARGALRDRKRDLGMKNPGNPIILVNCGVTALGKTEYLGIAVHYTLKIVEVGRVYLAPSNRGTEVKVDVAPSTIPKQWCTKSPSNGSADYRCVVYVIVQRKNQPHGPKIGVGFLHNMYNFKDNKNAAMQTLSLMMDRIEARCMGRVYIGGDFNTRPRNLGTAKGRVTIYYPYTAALKLEPPPAPAKKRKKPKFTGGGTLRSGRLYDYWYADDTFPQPKASVMPQTLGVGMSDHCGILLNIDFPH